MQRASNLRTESEISQLNMFITYNENILGFYITVNVTQMMLFVEKSRVFKRSRSK